MALANCDASEPVVYGSPWRSQISRTRGAISGYRHAGMFGNRWCSILEPEVAAQHVPDPPDLEVATAHDLSRVPPGPILFREVLLAERRRPLREVAAVDDGVRPAVPEHVRERVPCEHLHRQRTRERREEDVLDEPLPCGLARERPEIAGHLATRTPLRGGRSLRPRTEPVEETEIVGADGVLEEQSGERAHERLEQVDRLPGHVLGEAKRVVAEVAISPDDVGEDVVRRVVGPLPALRGADHVPFVGRGAELRVAHEVVLPVKHVVADLHVLEHLVGAERDHAGTPADRLEAEVDEEASRDAGDPCDRSDRPDVLGVTSADLRRVLLPKGVELAPQGLRLLR